MKVDPTGFSGTTLTRMISDLDRGARSMPALIVVIVAYGSRATYLEFIIRRVLESPGVTRVVIVDNGTEYSLNQLLEGFSTTKPVTVISEHTNLGSAGGFRLALGHLEAEELKDVYVLLLDDDTLPRRDAIERLAGRFSNVDNAGLAFFMNRNSKPYISKTLGRGVSLRHAHDTFAGLSLKTIYEQHWTFNRKQAGGINAVLTLEFAPYGGLCFPLNIVKQVGLPRADYFIYGDDTEFTTRLTRAGVPIHFVAESILDDLEPSWHVSTGTLIAAMDLSRDERRVFYSVRNLRKFERDYLQRNSLVAKSNLVLYLFALCVDSMVLILRGRGVHAVTRRLRLLRAACRAAGEEPMIPGPFETSHQGLN